jgi:phospholipid/cholesterol/gamma-HCH transport system ATP-binding protein
MIEIKNIKKSFNGKAVLTGIDLVIPDGMSTVIVGMSGCGKTVLLKSIIGLIKPDEGNIFVNGEEITKMKRKDLYRIREKFGVLFQGAALFDSMTVAENIGLALEEHTDHSESTIRERVRQKLAVVGLSGVEDINPAELSGGMKKRVGLARALIMDPQFVFFDEPTTGLDPIMADNINNLILETHKKLNITSVIVTHDMVSAFKIGDRIAMIKDGHIIFMGTPSEFKQNKKKEIKQFVEGKGDMF